MGISQFLPALAGGLMIGCAGAMFLLVNGRIMGASGLVGGLVDKSGNGNKSERWMFLVGLIVAPAIINLIWGAAPTNVTDNYLLLIVAGLLVGVGTRIGSGCTSGHGVCGMSRLSLRSIISTLIYIGAGVAIIPLARAIGVL